MMAKKTGDSVEDALMKHDLKDLLVIYNQIRKLSAHSLISGENGHSDSFTEVMSQFDDLALLLRAKRPKLSEIVATSVEIGAVVALLVKGTASTMRANNRRKERSAISQEVILQVWDDLKSESFFLDMPKEKQKELVAKECGGISVRSVERALKSRTE